MSGYYFGEEREAEERRLRAVEAYSDPASRSVLRELGVGSGWNCWEVGAGGGSVAYWLADIVGPGGHVLATDVDTRWLQNRSNLEVARHDVVEDDPPEGGFDLIHARFVFEHLPEPGQVLGRLTPALRQGGLLVVEDTDGLDLLIDPGIAEIEQICRAWEKAASSISWNPNLGDHLLASFKQCGLTGIQGVSYRRKTRGGPVWEATKLGLIRLHDRIIREGATRKALSLLVHALDDPTYMITGPPVTIAWGARDD